MIDDLFGGDVPPAPACPTEHRNRAVPNGSTPNSAPVANRASAAGTATAPQRKEAQANAICPQPRRPEVADKIPPRIQKLLRLTPEHLGDSYASIVLHLEAAAEDLQPTTTLDWMAVFLLAQHDHEIVAYWGHVRRLVDLKQPHAVRNLVKPGWEHFQPGQREFKPQGAAHATLVEEMGGVDWGHPKGLELDCDDATEKALHAKALARLKLQGLGPEALETEAFRQTLPEIETIQQLIEMLERRRAILLKDYLARRDVAMSLPVVDAEFDVVDQ